MLGSSWTLLVSLWCGHSCRLLVTDANQTHEQDVPCTGKAALTHTPKMRVGLKSSVRTHPELEAKLRIETMKVKGRQRNGANENLQAKSVLFHPTSIYRDE
ncbi:hypothetical protein EI94DRAFT_1142673 [Lactarius quietus]|nr:hypothetical protein EI94DRAFT_1142673 [Lactarius quietus]